MEEQPNNEQVPASETAPAPELVLELNFVPNWARKPPDENRYGGFSGDRESSGDRRPRRDRPDTRGGPSDRRGGPRDRRGAPPDRRGGDRDRRDERGRAPAPGRDSRRGPRDGDFDRRRDWVPLPEVHVRFVPDQKQLSAILRQLHASMKSYPVMEVASLLLSNPAFCQVIIEPLGGPSARDMRFYQCRECKMASIDRAVLATHILKAHIENYFEKEEKVSDPPAGQYVVIAKCGLSGILLGPPNHHSYNEKVQEMHRTRYPRMPLDEYKSRIVTVRDPELIEKWKDESRKQTIYRLKNQSDPKAEPMKMAEAEAHMMAKIVPSLMVETRRVSVPLDVAQKIEDQGLMRVLRMAWEKERRSSFSVSMALRGAFRSRDMHLFRAGKMDFVSAIRPVPLDPDHVIDSIREVLTYLQCHPGCTRKGLLEALRPGAAPDSSEAAKVLSPLGWLVERGHIIEFFNGTLSVPLGQKKTGETPPAEQNTAARPEAAPQTQPGVQSDPTASSK